MRPILCAALGGLLSLSAVAQEPGAGRFSMTPVEGGFLRLDTRTGEVALCRPVADSVECRATPNERAALEAEVDRLAKENAELKSRLGASAPSRTQQEMDRAIDFAERFMRRMMRILREEPQPDRT